MDRSSENSDEAKIELETLLRQDSFGERIEGVDASGNMTERKVAEKVRQHYLGRR